MEFFELYGINFNYNKIGISVRGGGKYVQKPDSESIGQLTLYIEDPTSDGTCGSTSDFNCKSIWISFLKWSLVKHSLLPLILV